MKVVTRHVWREYKEEVNFDRYEDKGKAIYKRRKETVERSFAEGKELPGHRYARFRGLSKVQMQCLLSAACQNMKKIALRLWGRGFSPAPKPDPTSSLRTCFHSSASPPSQKQHKTTPRLEKRGVVYTL